MRSLEISWDFLGFLGISWDFFGFLRISSDFLILHELSQVSTHWRVAERVQRVGTTGGAERDPSEGHSPMPHATYDMVRHDTVVPCFVLWGGAGHGLLPIDLDTVYSL